MPPRALLLHISEHAFGSRSSSCRILTSFRPNRSLRRFLHIKATPSTAAGPENGELPSLGGADGPGELGTLKGMAIDVRAMLICFRRCALDAQFEVLGAPYSLLSVSLSASQKLYTRRGTLVGVSGNAENVYNSACSLGPHWYRC